jgi:NADH-quinone oxidoreductase subunit C
MANPLSPSHLAPHIDPLLSHETVENLHAALQDKVGKNLVSSHIDRKEVTLETTPAQIVKVLTILRDDKRLQFTQLMDVCGVDWLGVRPATERFAVVYHLLSLAKNQRVRVVVRLPEAAPEVPSVTEVFAAAGWYEREAFDMYGIVFVGHPDLRRILTDYGFDGYPLRKDFPLTGYVETYYDAAQGRVAYKPVDLPQAFRHFDRVSDWRGVGNTTHLADADNVFDGGEFK